MVTGKTIKMATTSEENSSLNSEDLLLELRTFIKGAHPRSGHKLTSEEHARCAIRLLQTLPAARNAVLEHLCHVFDESVNLYLFELEGEATTGINLDDVIKNIHQVLSQFLKSNSEAWAPLLSAWSIDLLGKISSTYAGRRGVPHSSNLNELLQLWMTCRATRTLMDIASQCIAGMVSPDLCVDALLDTSVQHSPHFDWVVAHIGSCFPNTIITRVLSCGLKDFCHSQSKGLITTENEVPKMASVVGILGHLAGQHSQDIRKALLELFQESLGSKEQQHLFTVPFLLQLATMSPMLLRVITTDFVEALTPDVLNKLSVQFKQSSAVFMEEKDNLLSLVIHLICRSGSGAFKLLSFLLETASGEGFHGDENKVNDLVQQTCALILDLLLLDLQRSVYTKAKNISQMGSQDSSDIPFLAELQKHTNTLCVNIIHAKVKRADWLQRLLALIAVYCGEGCASDILTYILINEPRPEKIGLFITLQAEIEASFPSVLEVTVQKAVNQLQRIETKQTRQLMMNLTYLAQWERSEVNSGTKHKPRGTFSKCLLPRLHLVATQLHHTDLVIAAHTMKLLQLIGLPDDVTMVMMQAVSQSTVEFFMMAFHSTDPSWKAEVVETCRLYLRQLSLHPIGQPMVLRALLENLTYKDNRWLFSGRSAQAPKTSNAKIQQQTSLMNANNKLGACFIPPASGHSVFYAGTIGQGLKPRNEGPKITQDESWVNSQALVATILACASVKSDRSSTQPMETDSIVSGILRPDLTHSVDVSTARLLARMMEEIVCPDVTHVGILWPEEEHIKGTIERDLAIKRMFDDNPVLWDVLEMISRAKPALCDCVVIVYSILTTLLGHWESCRLTKASHTPQALASSYRLLQCIGMAGWLPPPICHSHHLLSELTPHEVYVLLASIWGFLKENPPKTESFTEKDENGQPARALPEAAVERQSELVHTIVHKNIAKFGNIFKLLFPPKEA
ncbi:integrator complex subunit 5-like [Amphiura filiformis]|uniref:integrator complex subunit 5-like n=1 Tax=Amphiura filiformis TaxID=82378 RepID=UPI003B2148F4